MGPSALFSTCLAGTKLKSIDVGKVIFEKNSRHVTTLPSLDLEEIPQTMQDRLPIQQVDNSYEAQNLYIVDEYNNQSRERKKGDADKEFGPGMLGWYSKSSSEKPVLVMSLGALNTHTPEHNYHVKGWKGRLFIPLTGTTASQKWAKEDVITDGKNIKISKRVAGSIRKQVFRASLVSKRPEGRRGWSMFSERRTTPAMVVVVPPELRQHEGKTVVCEAAHAHTYFALLQSGKGVLEALLNTQVSKIVCGAEGELKGRRGVWSTRETTAVIDESAVDLRGICDFYLSEMKKWAVTPSCVI